VTDRNTDWYLSTQEMYSHLYFSTKVTLSCCCIGDCERLNESRCCISVQRWQNYCTYQVGKVDWFVTIW